LDAIEDLPTLTNAFEREESRPGGQFGFDNFVQHRLAYAFALARLGQEARATEEFERWVGSHVVESEVGERLREALSATAPA
jgi:hypothetical protein